MLLTAGLSQAPAAGKVAIKPLKGQRQAGEVRSTPPGWPQREHKLTSPPPPVSQEEADATRGQHCRGRHRPPSPQAGWRSTRRGLPGGRGRPRVPPAPSSHPRGLAAAPRAARRGAGHEEAGGAGAISQPPPPDGSPLPQPPRRGGTARRHPAPTAT